MQFTLRRVGPGDASALAHVLVSAEQATFRGLVPDHCLEFTEDQSAANWARFLASGPPAGDRMVVAMEASGAVIAYAWGTPNAKDLPCMGELRQISVLPAYQGYGIGRQLVCHVARELEAIGVESLCARVLRVNPNTAFYERLGAVWVGDRPFDWDGVTLTEWIYRWKPLGALVAGVCGELRTTRDHSS